MFLVFATTASMTLEMWCLRHCLCFVAWSATSIIKAELQLLQSIISPSREKLCRHSPRRSLLHMVITPGVLNHPSFYIRVRESRIFADEFISVTALNGQCLRWCVHFSSMTQQFLAPRQASVRNVDFWQKTKAVVSTMAFLKCQGPVAPHVQGSCCFLITISLCYRPSTLRTGHAPHRAPL